MYILTATCSDSYIEKSTSLMTYNDPKGYDLCVKYNNMLNMCLPWLMPCHCRWNKVHRPLVSTQLCLVLLPPSSSSCTCILLSTFLSPDLFSKYSLVAVFLCGFVVHVQLMIVMMKTMMIACLYHLHFFVFHFSLTGQRSCSWLMELCAEWSIYIPYNRILLYMAIWRYRMFLSGMTWSLRFVWDCT